MNKYYLAVDIGASSGRHILCHIEDGLLITEEIHRFQNGAKRDENNVLCWDIDGLFEEILSGMKKCADKGIIPESVGIDTWGVDFVLVDKIPALLAFFDKVPLHVTRGVRWDSDHVVLFEDELKEIMKEIVRNGALDKVLIGLDFFDVSINRIAAWVIGARNAQKALLWALLQPDDELRKMQDNADFTGKMMLMEEVKTLPFGDVWEEYCARQGVSADKAWYDEVMDYERKVLVNR